MPYKNGNSYILELAKYYEQIKPNIRFLASGYLIYQMAHPGEPIDESLINQENMPFLSKELLSEQEEVALVYLEQIEAIRPNLVLCEIDPRVGKGLFWRGPGIIKKGTAVICYSGTMSFHQPNSFSGYEYSIPAHPLFKNPKEATTATGVIEGLNGNIARFAQHLPDATTLSEYFKFAPSIQAKNIATANIEAITTLIAGLPLVTFVATEDILPNSQIGFDYGLSYWAVAYRHAQIDFLLFNKQSEILDPIRYERLVVYLNVNKETTAALTVKEMLEHLLANEGYQCINAHNKKHGANLSYKELTTLLIEELKKQYPESNTVLYQLKKWLITIQQSPTNYQEQFIKIVHFLLLKHWLINTIDQRAMVQIKAPYIKKILDSIEDKSLTADEIYRRVHKSIAIEESDFYMNYLSEMRQGMINAMKVYNSEKTAINKQLLDTTEAPEFTI